MNFLCIVLAVVAGVVAWLFLRLLFNDYQKTSVNIFRAFSFLIGVLCVGFMAGYFYNSDRPSRPAEYYMTENMLFPPLSEKASLSTNGIRADINLKNSEIDLVYNHNIGFADAVFNSFLKDAEKTIKVFAQHTKGHKSYMQVLHYIGTVGGVITGFAPGYYAAEQIKIHKTVNESINDKAKWWSAIALNNGKLFNLYNIDRERNGEAISFTPKNSSAKNFLGIDKTVYVVRLNDWYYGKKLDSQNLQRLLDSCKGRMNDITLAFYLPSIFEDDEKRIYLKDIRMFGLPNNMTHKLISLDGMKALAPKDTKLQSFTAEMKKKEAEAQKDLEAAIKDIENILRMLESFSKTTYSSPAYPVYPVYSNPFIVSDFMYNNGSSEYYYQMQDQQIRQNEINNARESLQAFQDIYDNSDLYSTRAAASRHITELRQHIGNLQSGY